MCTMRKGCHLLIRDVMRLMCQLDDLYPGGKFGCIRAESFQNRAALRSIGCLPASWSSGATEFWVPLIIWDLISYLCEPMVVRTTMNTNKSTNNRPKQQQQIYINKEPGAGGGIPETIRKLSFLDALSPEKHSLFEEHASKAKGVGNPATTPSSRINFSESGELQRVSTRVGARKRGREVTAPISTRSWLFR